MTIFISKIQIFALKIQLFATNRIFIYQKYKFLSHIGTYCKPKLGGKTPKLGEETPKLLK